MLVRIKPTSSQSEPDLSGKRTPQTLSHTTATVSSPRRLRFLAELVPVVLLVLPLSVHAGVFSSLWAMFNESAAAAPAFVAEPANAQHTPLLSAARNFEAVGGGDVTVADGQALVSSGPVPEEQIAAARTQSVGEISVYTVRPGDSLSQIAEMYDVTTNTIMWANDLTGSTDIQPGDSLVILPVAGVRHTIKEGDSLSTVVDKYDADTEEVLAYNNLTADSELVVGEEIIIPGGTVTPPPAAKVATPTRTSGGSSVASTAGWLAHPAPGSVRSQGLHGYNGIDFAASVGTPIRAAAAGEVIVARAGGWNGGYGTYIVIRHNNGAQTLYAHMSRLSVSAGSYVSQGQTVGSMGNTGRSTGPHLHFEVRGASNPF